MDLELSDGSILQVPDDTPDDQAIVLMRQAEDQLGGTGKMLTGMDNPAPMDPNADLGEVPVPVEEDKPGWDWLRNNAPGVFNRGHELVSGIAEGVAELPNAVPNMVNTGKSLYDLHFGSGTGEVAPEDQWQPWMDDPSKTIRELNPPAAPDLEDWRDYGRATGAALPFGPEAALVVPAISKGGGFVGSLADRYIDPNDNAKWQRTGEVVAPLATGLVTKGARAVPWEGVGKVVTPAATALAVGERLLHGDLWGAAGAGVVMPKALKTIGKAAPYVAPVLNPLLDAAEGSSLPSLLARSTAPAARDNLNRSY